MRCAIIAVAQNRSSACLAPYIGDVATTPDSERFRVDIVCVDEDARRQLYEEAQKHFAFTVPEQSYSRRDVAVRNDGAEVLSVGGVAQMLLAEHEHTSPQRVETLFAYSWELASAERLAEEFAKLAPTQRITVNEFDDASGKWVVRKVVSP
jgi:hypothetical protein